MTRPRSPLLPASALVLALAALPLPARAEAPRDLQQMSLEDLLKVKLTVASRTETTVDEAPSVVSVITAEDIQRMGARDCLGGANWSTNCGICRSWVEG